MTVIPYGSFSCQTIHASTLNINGANINQQYQSKADMATYITSGSLTNYVNVNNSQTFGGEQTFSNSMLVKNGRGSVKVYPQTGQVGPTTIHTYRYSDQAMPSQGDHSEFGQDVLSNIQGWEWLQRTFVIASGGGGRIMPRFYIDSTGLVSVMADVPQALIHHY